MTVDTTRIAAGDLAALLGSRLCHDLVSPLGAIGNGVELLEMSPDFPDIAQSPEMRLIAEAVSAARSRIQGYRMAFGMASGDQRIPLAEAQRLLDGMTAQGRLAITLQADGNFARTDIRMVMLALMCLETAMPWGGSVTVLRQAPCWRLVATCARLKHDPELWAWLDGGAARTPAASEVHFAMLSETAREAGKRLSHQLDDKGGEIGF
ncbi:histidine phosphotransferase family protein [Paracoccus sp. JM45]|uniref:histidine phosphotransferase family protein n=1 Tax=Paracoccus sp. JM45 TaxID=2283626 RepID=UPI000E6CD2E1|nr:histidine phosphotransferase family protein [Paracoccus sp. JM45]RJE81112.1 histidine phosphotransferase [Paracoccus sp. JM45]